MLNSTPATNVDAIDATLKSGGSNTPAQSVGALINT